MGRARAVAEVPIEDFQESTNILVHAWPGQGKTRWGIGAPNCQLLSAEPGAVSAKRHVKELGLKNVGLVRIRTWPEAKAWKQSLLDGEYERDWVIIDTLSTIQRQNQNFVLDSAVAENPRRDPDIPAIQDYQKQQNSLTRWVEEIVDCPINKIWLCHTMRVEDRDGGAMMMPAILGGQDKGFPIANYVMGLMNCVGYMEMRAVKGKMVRRILWQPYNNEETGIRYVAKDHFGALGRFTDDLDFQAHLDMIEGRRKAKAAEPSPAEEPVEENLADEDDSAEQEPQPRRPATRRRRA